MIKLMLNSDHLYVPRHINEVISETALRIVDNGMNRNLLNKSVDSSNKNSNNIFWADDILMGETTCKNLEIAGSVSKFEYQYEICDKDDCIIELAFGGDLTVIDTVTKYLKDSMKNFIDYPYIDASTKISVLSDSDVSVLKIRYSIPCHGSHWYLRAGVYSISEVE